MESGLMVFETRWFLNNEAREYGRYRKALSLSKSFQFCAGGAADISRWRQPPEGQLLLPLRLGRGAGRVVMKTKILCLKTHSGALPGRNVMVPGSRWLAPPANIRRPFRAKIRRDSTPFRLEICIGGAISLRLCS